MRACLTSNQDKGSKCIPSAQAGCAILEHSVPLYKVEMFRVQVLTQSNSRVKASRKSKDSPCPWAD